MSRHRSFASPCIPRSATVHPSNHMSSRRLIRSNRESPRRRSNSESECMSWPSDTRTTPGAAPVRGPSCPAAPARDPRSVHEDGDGDLLPVGRPTPQPPQDEHRPRPEGERDRGAEQESARAWQDRPGHELKSGAAGSLRQGWRGPAKPGASDYIHASPRTGRSAARLARLLREQEVPGSNPGAPILTKRNPAGP